MKREYPRKKVRRRILSETKQILLGIDPEMAERLFCLICGETVEMVSPLLAAKLSDISTREIYRLIETGKLHTVEFEDRRIFVCLKSLEQLRDGFSHLSLEIKST